MRAVDPRLPVLMVTGFLKDASAEQLAKDPCLRMVPKPFSPEELLSAVGQLLALAR